MSVAPSVSTNLEVEPQSEGVRFQKCVRTVLLEHSGTLKDGELVGRSWFMPSVGANGMKVFGAPMDSVNVTSGSQGLSNARVSKLELLEYNSTFPMVLKLDSEGFPKDASDLSGNRTLAHILPGRNCTPETLFEADHSSSDAVQWQKKFPEYTSSNLVTHGTMEVRSAPIIFVAKDHPVCALLRSNKEYLGQDLNEQQLVQGKWHTIARPIFEHAVNVLRKTVLSQVQHVTLQNCSFHLEPVGKSGWGQPKAEFDTQMASVIAAEAPDMKSMLQKATQMATNRPYSFCARLRFTYEIPCTT